jgi:hypothetical protein
MPALLKALIALIAAIVGIVTGTQVKKNIQGNEKPPAIEAPYSLDETSEVVHYEEA